MNITQRDQLRKRKAKERASFLKRLDVIDAMLSTDVLVHPAGCNCAIKSRVVGNHRRDCPYRMLKEILPELRATVSSGGSAS